MRTVVLASILGIITLLGNGCAALKTAAGRPDATTAEIVAEYLPQIETASYLIAKAVLTYAVSPEDATHKANYLCTLWPLVNSLTDGKTPVKPAALESAIQLWMPAKAHWTDFGTAIVGVYQGFYGRFNPDAKLSLQVLNAIAAGANRAAVEILASK